MKSKLEPPVFTSDAEESEWWQAHREDVNQKILDSFAKGKVRIGVTRPGGVTPPQALGSIRPISKWLGSRLNSVAYETAA